MAGCTLLVMGVGFTWKHPPLSGTASWCQVSRECEAHEQVSAPPMFCVA